MSANILRRSMFTEDFVRLNYPEKKNIFRWAFLPGMLFQDYGCWWKAGRRVRFHEGVDFCHFYGNGELTLQKVKADRVPALFDGLVLRVEEDFLAKTVWMKHDGISCGNMMLFSALAHVHPAECMEEGKTICQGEVVATIGQRQEFFPMDMHLHVTVFWAPHFIKTSRINWRQLTASRQISFVDPLQVISRNP